jgi:hypothetical protein
MASIDDWPSFARGLGVVGITKQLAQQSELVSFQDGLSVCACPVVPGIWPSACIRTSCCWRCKLHSVPP